MIRPGKSLACWWRCGRCTVLQLWGIYTQRSRKAKCLPCLQAMNTPNNTGGVTRRPRARLEVWFVDVLHMWRGTFRHRGWDNFICLFYVKLMMTDGWMKTDKERNYILVYFLMYFLTERSKCSGPDFNRKQGRVTLFPVCSVSKAKRNLIISNISTSWETVMVSPFAQITLK